MTCILSDDTDVFCLTFVVGESGRHSVQGTDGAMGWFSTDTNSTCPDFGQKCLQLPGMLTLSHSDKGNAIALNVI